MKANELRIGNWVNLYGDDCRIQTLGMWVHTETTVDEAPIESVKPIPLTEEWLLKFGFEVYSEYDFKNYRLPDGFFISMWMKDKPVAGFEERGVCYWGDNYVPVRYVHRLQNLYFELTGTALELKQ